MVLFEVWNRDPTCRGGLLSKAPETVTHATDDAHHPVFSRYSVYTGLVYGRVCMHVIAGGRLTHEGCIWAARRQRGEVKRGEARRPWRLALRAYRQEIESAVLFA